MFAGQRIVPPRGSERASVFAGLWARKLPLREFLAGKPWTRVPFSRLFALAVRHPRDAALAIGGAVAVVAIVSNTLFMQSGPHPAPIFAIRPLPVVAHEETGAVSQLPRPRPATADVRKPDQKIDPVPLPRPRAQPASAAGRPDPIADLINPTRQLSAVQRALNDFGYGPVKVTGSFDDDTRESIERFEHDHNLAVTGQNTPRLRHALSLATGRPLD
jgi:hypothetical protein